jgi:hypothetical protein
MRSLKKSSVINLVSQQISKTKEEVSTYLLILSLHVNGLNCSIQRCRLAEWIKKKKGSNGLLATRNSPHWQRYT